MHRVTIHPASPSAWVLLLLATGGCGAPRGAQPEHPPSQAAAVVSPAPPPAQPVFPTEVREGSLSLSPGHGPQPWVVLGTAVGQRPATELGAPCPSFVSERPEYLVELEQPFETLSVLAQSETPVSVMVMSRQGQFLCSEPGSARVRAPFAAGPYAVWVGTAAEGQRANYRLGFAENPRAVPAQLPTSLTGAWNARGEPITLTPGFEPDPRVVEGEAHGRIEASQLDPSCVGFIAPQPDHLLFARQDFEHLKILVRHNRDTALVMTDTHGHVFCNDDGEGRFPVIEKRFARGHYRIWIATKGRNVHVRYTLGVTQSPDAAVWTLPRPGMR